MKSDKVPVDDFKLSVYGLRHTRASYLIHSGIPVDICAKVLGVILYYNLKKLIVICYLKREMKVLKRLEKYCERDSFRGN